MNLAIRASGKLGFTVELPANEPTERSGSIHAASVTLQEVPSAMCVCVCVCVQVCVGGRVHVCACMYMFACMHVCAHVFLHLASPGPLASFLSPICSLLAWACFFLPLLPEYFSL